MARTRLRAQRRALWLRALWSAETSGKGIAISHDEVDRILNDPAEAAAQEAAFYEENRETQELTRRIAEADESAQSDARWCALCHTFELTPEEGDLLALAAAVSADPGFGRVCGYLHDDASACYATPLLAAALYGWREPMTADSALARWHLAQVPQSTANPCAPNAPWVADPYIVQWLRGDRAVDPVVAPAVEILPAAEVASLEILDPDTHGAIRNFLAAVRTPVEIELTGPEGTGKRTLAAQVYAEIGADLMVVDARVLAAGEPAPGLLLERVMHAIRAARLEGAIVYWNHADALDERARRMVEGSGAVAFFGSEVPLKTATTTLVARASFEVLPPGEAARTRLWRRFTDAPLPETIRGWSLRPAEIRAASLVAHAGPAAVVEACRHMLHNQPGELFTTLSCPYVWDDIVLAQGIRRQLEELTAQARLRTAVSRGMGFRPALPHGPGPERSLRGPQRDRKNHGRPGGGAGARPRALPGRPGRRGEQIYRRDGKAPEAAYSRSASGRRWCCSSMRPTRYSDSAHR